MTACDTRPAPLTISADGSYAARLTPTGDGDGWCPERWTLSGPEPYAVRLPAARPEEQASEVLPLSDGRVLIVRRADGRHHCALLYPSGPDTGELPLGAVECERLTLLPPAPDGSRVFALAPGPQDGVTDLWLVCGGAFGPELVTRVPGHCSGGAWLDGPGRLLALDRTDAAGRTRTVAVDVEHGGEPSALLQIAEDSNDRLLLADPDSGLILVRSDAPGTDRIGWGVLGSHRPVRFPEALHPQGVRVTPFAAQPGQVLVPEGCAVALRMTTHEADWVAVWRPQQKEAQHLTPPEGWLSGTGLWTAGGELLLPFSTAHTPWGLARFPVPVPAAPPPVPVPGGPGAPGGVAAPGGPGAPGHPVPQQQSPQQSGPVPAPAAGEGAPATEGVTKPVPLQQAPLARV